MKKRKPCSVGLFLPVFLLLLGSGFAAPDCRAQSLLFGSSPTRRSLSGEAGFGIWGGDVYISALGTAGFRCERELLRGLSFATGLSGYASGYGASVGVPLELQFALLNKRGGGLLLSGGALAHVGHGQPFFFPKFSGRLRGALGHSRYFVEAQLFVLMHYAYGCLYGNYTCPNGPFRNNGWGGSAGLGVSVGRYLK